MKTGEVKWAYGRAREVLRDEGARAFLARARNYRGGRPVRFESGLRAKTPPMGRGVLIVAHRTPAQCYRYRVAQKLEALRYAGIPAVHVEAEDLPRARSLLGFSSMLIIYRVASSHGLEDLVAEARRQGIPVVYELDDAVYRSDLLESSEALHSVPRAVRRNVMRGAPLFEEAMRSADHCLASTPALAEDMSRYVPGRSFVIPNGADDGMWRIARGISEKPPPADLSDAVWLVYASGSTTHDHDLRSIAAPLVEVLSRHPNARLRLMGPLSLPPALNRFQSRILHDPPMPYSRFLWNQSANDVVLGPLVPDGFNVFKSPVKFIESNVLGKPFIGSPTVFGEYVEAGRTGLIVGSETEWVEGLSRLLTDASMRSSLAAAGTAYQRANSTDQDLAKCVGSLVEEVTEQGGSS